MYNRASLFFQFCHQRTCAISKKIEVTCFNNNPNLPFQEHYLEDSLSATFLICWIETLPFQATPWCFRHLLVTWLLSFQQNYFTLIFLAFRPWLFSITLITHREISNKAICTHRVRIVFRPFSRPNSECRDVVRFQSFHSKCKFVEKSTY